MADNEHPTQPTASPHAGTQVQGPDQQARSASWSLDADNSVPGYQLQNEIGRGGMGVVFRARDLALNREVAVKILQEQFATDSPTALRFVAEAEITGQLQHPGIPAVYHVGRTSDGRPFLAMKLIKGETLDDLRKADKPINALGVFEAICQAVGYAHAHQVIHRDLKPSNVMVGNFGEVQVMDWGLAKVLGGPEPVRSETTVDERPRLMTEIRPQRDSDTPFTLCGSVMGTLAYMAPEQAAGEVEKVDTRSDVFGLGAILCALLTGQAPFTGVDFKTVRLNAMRGKTEEAFARLDACGAEPELTALCKSCLAFEPASRPADATILARQVAELRRAAEERARQAELTQARSEVQAAESAKRRKVIAIGGGVLIVALLVGSLGTTVGFVRAERQRRSADELRKKAEQAEAEALEEFRAGTDDAIENLIGSKPRLGAPERAYLEQTLKRWQSFADRAGDDARSRAIRAEGKFRVAFLWQRLGQLDKAIAGYRESLAERKQLVSEHPQEPSYRQAAANNHNNLGVVLKFQNKREEAIEQYAEAISLRQHLADDFPDNPLYRQELAASHHNIGNVLNELERRDKAMEHYVRALEIRVKLADEVPSVTRHRLELARTHNTVGNVHRARNKLDEAATHYTKAMTLSQKLVAEAPETPAHHQELAGALLNLGNLFMSQNKRDAAAEHYTQALAVQQKLVDEFPAMPGFRQELALTEFNLGVLFAGQGKLEKALEHFSKSLSVRQKLADEFRSFTVYRQDVIRSHLGLSTLFAGWKKDAEARDHQLKALALRQALADENPDNNTYKIDLSLGQTAYANLLLDQGQPADSVPWYEKARKTIEPIHDQDPRVAAPRQVLRNVHLGRALAYHRMAKYVEALRDWDRAVDLSSEAEKPRLKARRVSTRIQAGQVAEAIAETTELIKTPGWPAEHWYDFACAYSVASGKFPDKKAEYANKAMDLLREAVKAGFKQTAHMAKDRDMDPLRERDDYKKLIEGMEKKK